MSTLQSVERRARLFLAELCSTPSPSGDEGALLIPLERELSRLGAELRIIDVAEGRFNILALWGQPRVLFSSHLDVVPPQLPVSADESGLSGRGACDAKGQIAAQLAAVDLLLGSHGPGLAWLGVCGEESDSAGAMAAIGLAPLFTACRAIIVGEPTGGSLARGQKGFLRLRLDCVGKAAHGGTPERGENAVYALMDWLSALRGATPALHPALGAETYNVGTVSGGVAANVVPDAASAELTLRTVPGGRLRAAIDAARPRGGKVEVLVDEGWDFFDLPEGFPSVDVPFGSDLPAMRAIAPSAAAILAGPGSIALAHGPDERIEWAALDEGIALFRDLGAHYLGGDA